MRLATLEAMCQQPRRSCRRIYGCQPAPHQRPQQHARRLFGGQAPAPLRRPPADPSLFGGPTFCMSRPLRMPQTRTERNDAMRTAHCSIEGVHIYVYIYIGDRESTLAFLIPEFGNAWVCRLPPSTCVYGGAAPHTCKLGEGGLYTRTHSQIQVQECKGTCSRQGERRPEKERTSDVRGSVPPLHGGRGGG